MKKALLSLLLGLVALPMAFGQQVVIDDTTMCKPLKWRNNQTFTRDTNVVYTTDSVIYVLMYKRPAYDTTGLAAKPIEVIGECVATWNGKTWTRPGNYIDTSLFVDPTPSCKINRIHVTLATTDSVESLAACDSYTAPWGDTYTTSTVVDTTITHGDCSYRKNLTLTINPSYGAHNVLVEAECEYIWNKDTIHDFNVHTDTLLTVAGGCDSIVNLRVTSYSGHAHHVYNIAACDTFLTDSRIRTWNDTLSVSGTYTYDTVYGTYPVNATSTMSCTHHNTLNLTIVVSNNDSSSVTPVVIPETECSYEWEGLVIHDDSVHYRLLSSVIGGCDSIAAIRVASFTGHIYDTSVVEYCGKTYQWKNAAFAGQPNYSNTNGFSFTYDTVANVQVTDTSYFIHTGATASRCIKHFTLDLSFFTKHDTIKDRKICGFEYTLPTSSYKIRNSNGQYVTPSNNVPPFTESGTYEVNGNGDSIWTVTSSGCATRKTLQLLLKNPEQLYRSETPINVVACDQYHVFLDNVRLTTLRSSCDTTFTVPNRDDYYTCYDSILLLNLTIKLSSRDEVVVDTCDIYYWPDADTTFTSSITKDLKHSVPNAVGCDSITRLKLTIHYTPVVNIIGDWVLAPGGSTTLRAEPDMAISNYAWYVNDESTPRSQGADASSFVLSNVRSNTDVRLLSTSNFGCTATSWITISANVGIDDVDNLQAVIYPNPTSRYLNIESGEGIREVTVYNAVGQQVIVRSGEGNSLRLDLHGLAAGNYTLRILGLDGQQSTRKFIVNK